MANIKITGAPKLVRTSTTPFSSTATQTVAIDFDYDTTGSYGEGLDQNIGTSITMIQTGSVTNIAYIAGRNLSTSSVVIYSDAAGTKIISTLRPDWPFFIPQSGSITPYAKSLTSPAVVHFQISEQ